MKQPFNKQLIRGNFFLYILSCLIGMQLMACSDSDDNDGGKDTPTNVAKSISGKWDMATSNSQFSYIEFNDDNIYVIVGNNLKARSSALSKSKGGISPRSAETSSTVYSGKYEIKDNKTIVLENLGILEIKSITESNFDFSLTLTTDAGGISKKIDCKSSKSKSLSESERTTLLCSTYWLAEDEKEYAMVRFFKSGIYLVSTTSEDGYDAVNWKWSDSKEQSISYEWEDGDKGTLRVDKLTSTELIFTEYFDADTITTRCIASQNGLLPQIPTFDFKLEVRECKWISADSTTYKLSKGADVMFYVKQEGQYDLIYTTKTSDKGIAEFKAPFKADTLYYTVENSGKKPFYRNYRIMGMFANEEQIKNYPTYNDSEIGRTEIGNFMFLDKNGDGKIDGQDKFTNAYIPQPISKDKAVQNVAYIGAYEQNAVVGPSVQEIDNFLNIHFGFAVNTLYALDYDIQNTSNLFPKCDKIDKQTLNSWKACYNFFGLMNTAKESYVKWNKGDKAYWDQPSVSGFHKAQQAYLYTTLVDLYGDMPLILSTNIIENSRISRNPASEIIQFVESETAQMPQQYQLASKQVLARHYMNEKNYNKALMLTEEIINSGKFSMNADSISVFETSSNKETLLLGYKSDNRSYKGLFVHPLRYTETILTAAEAAHRLGNLQKTAQYFNLWTAARNKAQVKLVSELELQNAYSTEFKNEGQWFTTQAKRWGTLWKNVSEAATHNNLLPIPRSEINANPNFSQNPGY